MQGLHSVRFSVGMSNTPPIKWFLVVEWYGFVLKHYYFTSLSDPLLSTILRLLNFSPLGKVTTKWYDADLDDPENVNPIQHLDEGVQWTATALNAFKLLSV